MLTVAHGEVNFGSTLTQQTGPSLSQHCWHVYWDDSLWVNWMSAWRKGQVEGVCVWVYSSIYNVTVVTVRQESFMASAGLLLTLKYCYMIVDGFVSINEWMCGPVRHQTQIKLSELMCNKYFSLSAVIMEVTMFDHGVNKDDKWSANSPKWKCSQITETYRKMKMFRVRLSSRTRFSNWISLKSQ